MQTAQDWLNLAVEASNEGRPHDAGPMYHQALALDGGLGEAWLGLGLCYLATQKPREAVDCLRRAVKDPEAAAVWHVCLGQSLFGIGEFAESAQAFQQADEMEPLTGNARRVYARAHMLTTALTGPVADALTHYQAVAGDEAEPVPAIMKDAFAMLNAFGYREAAVAVGRWRLAQNPDDAVQAYMLDAAAGVQVAEAPAAYLEAHFDAYAETFEKHLVEDLGYKIPAEMAELVGSYRRHFSHMLDLGCGTGLAAPSLAVFGGHLTGLDIAGAMLARAEARGGYDALVQREAVDYLRETPATFDLIFAADLFIYFGDLQSLLEAVMHVLKPGGLIAFNTETGSEDWTILSSGRFAHSDDYVRRMAGARLTCLSQSPVVLRHENARAVAGTLHLFEATAWSGRSASSAGR